MVEPRILAGFMELLPEDQIKFNNMVDKIRKSYEKFGFLPLDTPVLELAEVLLAKAGGETEKQIYRIDKGGDSDIVMRFDLTVPLARFVAKNSNDIAFPFRRYQIGKVYRGERPQKGRFREFYQCDIDIIGDGELPIINDAEIPSIIYDTFKDLGFNEFVISMNNRKILNGLFAYAGAENLAVDIMRTIDKFDKIGQEKVEAELKELGLSDAVVNTIIKFILISGTVDEKIALLEKLNIDDPTFIEGLNELKEVVKYIRILGVPDTHFTIDLKIARGLDYYTGTVYETFLTGYREIGSVCSGGRYENLAGFYTDKKLPGVGISIGLTRLFYKLQELDLLDKTKTSIADVLVMSMDEQIDDCLELATYFRSNNVNTEVYFANKKFKAKMKYANRLQVPYIVIMGEEERNQGKCTLKNMVTGEQELVSKEEIVERIKK
ncbi:MAG: histidine--tRNA ligase [Clostridiales bacterium]|nr:histidine--tRNA ligase [Clostridiales bacterium]